MKFICNIHNTNVDIERLNTSSGQKTMKSCHIAILLSKSTLVVAWFITLFLISLSRIFPCAHQNRHRSNTCICPTLTCTSTTLLNNQQQVFLFTTILVCITELFPFWAVVTVANVYFHSPLFYTCILQYNDHHSTLLTLHTIQRWKQKHCTL